MPFPGSILKRQAHTQTCMVVKVAEQSRLLRCSEDHLRLEMESHLVGLTALQLQLAPV